MQPSCESKGKNAQDDRQGNIMIMVSHAHQLVESFCNRVVWMDHSKLVEDGLPGDIAKCYLARNLNE